MTDRILRVRFSNAEISESYPFKLSYLVPVALYDDIYTRFGPAFSCKAPVKTVRYYFANDDAMRVVVPLRTFGQGKLKNVVSERVMKRISGGALSQAAKSRRLLEHMARTIPGDSATLHLATGAHQVCTFCTQQMLYLLGECTFGCSQCVEHIEVPIDSILQNTGRHPSATRDASRHHLPTVR